jgi:CBS domain containing-hemolysin-like protein
LGVALAAYLALAFTATVELGLAAVSRVTVRELIEERAAAHHVHSLVERPQDIRASLLLCELLTAAIGVSLVVTLFDRQFGLQSTLLALVLNVVLVILLSRAIPALIVAGASRETAKFERIGSLVATVVAPLMVVTNGMSRLVTRGKRNGERDGSDEASDANGEARDGNGHPDQDAIEEEHEMISAILDLDQAMVHEIMVPRTDITAVSVETGVLEVVELARTVGHSRIPVYRDSIDVIIGVVHAKDFLRFVDNDSTDVELLELLRPAYFVPESKHVGELLHDLRSEKVHLAVVVDEYGGTAGIVTIEDILEEIVGEIQDEYDRELPLLERIGPDEVIVDGRIPIDELAEIFDTDFSDGDYDTIGGFVQKQLGRIPGAGETVEADGLRFEVQTVEHRRIRTVRVLRLAELSTISGENG